MTDKTTLFIIRSVLFTFITVPLFFAHADDDDSEKKRYHKISDWDDDSSELAISHLQIYKKIKTCLLFYLTVCYKIVKRVVIFLNQASPAARSWRPAHESNHQVLKMIRDGKADYIYLNTSLFKKIDLGGNK